LTTLANKEYVIYTELFLGGLGPQMNSSSEERIDVIEQLFNSLQTGDLDTFNEIIVPIRGRVIRLAQQRLQIEDVEDVVQQTLSTFWEKRLSVHDSEHLLPFLLQILRNKLGDSYRRKKRQRKMLRAYKEHLNSTQNKIPKNPEHHLEEQELEEVLREAIAICAAENQLWGKVLQLLQQGLSRDEIRRELGNIPMATVYTRIHRARKRLMRILEEEFGIKI
jgi:RNA polymerase sigma factor (sigma-70 family)